jgi:hypothetical protein
MQTSFSGVVGGGVYGKVVGIAHTTMTGAGVIITAFQASILISTRVGGDTTGTVIGTGTAGIMNGSLTNGFNRIGRAGTILDIGNGKQPGASRAINLERNLRDRN